MLYSGTVSGEREDAFWHALGHVVCVTFELSNGRLDHPHPRWLNPQPSKRAVATKLKRSACLFSSALCGFAKWITVNRKAKDWVWGTSWGISLRKGIKAFCLCSEFAPRPLVLTWVRAAGWQSAGWCHSAGSPSPSCYNHAVSSSAAALHCEVVPSWLWKGGVLARSGTSEICVGSPVRLWHSLRATGLLI